MNGIRAVPESSLTRDLGDQGLDQGPTRCAGARVRRNLDDMNTTTNMNPTESIDSGPVTARPQLRRSLHDRMLTGTAAGIADYLNVDPTLVRIGFAVLTLMGPGFPIYLAALLLIPEEGSDESIATAMINSFQNKGERS